MSLNVTALEERFLALEKLVAEVQATLNPVSRYLPVLTEDDATGLWEELGTSAFRWLMAQLLLATIALVWHKLLAPVITRRRNRMRKQNAEVDGPTRWSRCRRVLSDTVRAMQTSMVWLHLLESVLSLVVCGFWIARCYMNRFPEWMRSLELLCDLCFFTFLILRLLANPKPLAFCLSFRTMVEMFAIISSVSSASTGDWLSFSYLRGVQLHYAFVSLRYMQAFQLLRLNEYQKQIFNMGIDAVILVFVFSCTIFTFEILGEMPILVSCPDTNCDPHAWNFQNAVYFIFITVSTVGYGDFSPTTLLGRLSIICFIVVGVVLFSDAASMLVSISQSQKLGHGDFASASNYHVLVMGTPSLTMIFDFLGEMYHSERTNASFVASVRQVVFLHHSESFLKEARLLVERDRRFVQRVKFIVGSPLAKEDLLRAQAPEAEAVFVMSACGPPAQRDRVDVDNVFRAMSSMKLCRDVPHFIMLSSQRNEERLLSSNMDDTQNYVFRDRLMMGLLALSCSARGAVPFIYNLVKTRGASDSDDSVKKDAWFKEYECGADNELYVLRLRNAYRRQDGSREDIIGRPFVEVARNVFLDFGMLLLGYVDSTGRVRLNPASDIPEMAFGVVIADTDLEAARIGDLVSSRRDLQAKNKEDDKEDQMDEQVHRLSYRRRHVTMRGPEGGLIGLEGLTDEEDVQQELIDAQGGGLPRGKRVCMPRLVAPGKDFRMHVVVVCFTLKGIAYFIRPIRAREERLRDSNPDVVTQPIVLLCESKPSPAAFRGMPKHYLRKVYYHVGSPMHDEDLEAVSVTHASRILILSSSSENSIPSDGGEGDGPSVEEGLADADGIFAYLHLKNYLQQHSADIFTMMELSNEASVSYVSKSATPELWSNPLFASGQVYSPNMAHLILTQAFFNTHYLAVLKAFVSGTQKQVFKKAHLFQVPLWGRLEEYARRTWRELVCFFLDGNNSLGYFPVALYRNNRHRHCGCEEEQCPTADRPWVFTAPTMDTVLCPFDRVFVLSQTVGTGDLKKQSGNLFEADTDMHDLFSQFDKDGSGTLEKNEVGDLLKHLNRPMSELDDLFSEMDKDGHGHVDFKSFLESLSDKRYILYQEHRGPGPLPRLLSAPTIYSGDSFDGAGGSVEMQGVASTPSTRNTQDDEKRPETESGRISVSSPPSPSRQSSSSGTSSHTSSPRAFAEHEHTPLLTSPLQHTLSPPSTPSASPTHSASSYVMASVEPMDSSDDQE